MLNSGALLLALFLAGASADAQDATIVKLDYAPAPVANPLKGLVPYAGDRKNAFPHTMEFNYIAFGDLMKGYDAFDWQRLEDLLNEIAGRGRQTVFRVFLEYPGRTDVLPQFLLADGLKVHKYINTNTQPLPPAKVETPDYQDKNLRRALKQFIAALGKKYDGDPRIGFITAGLLGTWGEWHTYPKEELFASKEVQAEVLDAYEAAFKLTPVLLRYPVGEASKDKAPNAHRRFGYHDDSFAWATLSTGKPADDWFYMTTLQAAGPKALDKWKIQPIGGEIRPEAWGQVFDPKPRDRNIQNFRKCVDATHVTWLMDTGMFDKKPTAERRARAEAEVRRMGYEFHVPKISIRSNRPNQWFVQVHLENRGVAPFYYDWKLEYGLLVDGKLFKTFPATGKLRGLLPGDEPRTWSDTLDAKNVPAGECVWALRVIQPMKGGVPLRFANTTQDQHLPGWLTLTSVKR